MFKIIKARYCSSNKKKIIVEAAEIARKARPGRTVSCVVRKVSGARSVTPSPIVTLEEGTIALIFQEIGFPLGSSTPTRLPAIPIRRVQAPWASLRILKISAQLAMTRVSIVEIYPVVKAMKSRKPSASIIGARRRPKYPERRAARYCVNFSLRIAGKERMFLLSPFRCNKLSPHR